MRCNVAERERQVISKISRVETTIFQTERGTNRLKNCGGSAHDILEIANAVLAVPELLVTFVQKNLKIPENADMTVGNVRPGKRR